MLLLVYVDNNYVVFIFDVRLFLFLSEYSNWREKAQDSRVRLKRLKEDIINKTEAANVINITLPNTDNDDQMDPKDCDDYLENYITLVVQRLAHLIDKNVEQYKCFTENTREAFDCRESVRHLHQCVINAKLSSGVLYDQYISKVQAHLINGSRTEHQLCIIRGHDGCGKSSIISKACFRARELFGKDAVIIPIFIGLTEKSLLAEDVFRTLCYQIEILFKQENSVNLTTLTLKKLSNYFRELTNKVSKSPRHVLIFIDGLEKMQMYHNTEDQSFDAVDWLAMRFPAKFHVIVTCCSSEPSVILKRLESKLVQRDVFINIGIMLEEDRNTVLNQTLLRSRRKLSDQQQKAVLKTFSVEGNPQVILYNSNKSCQWHSTVDPDSLNDLLPTTVDGLIDDILAKLELTVGKTIAQYVCTYIALARFGLTEVEICDTLSLNDEILLLTYPDSKPDVFRFPCVKWCQILDTLGK